MIFRRDDPKSIRYLHKQSPHPDPSHPLQRATPNPYCLIPLAPSPTPGTDPPPPCSVHVLLTVRPPQPAEDVAPRTLSAVQTLMRYRAGRTSARRQSLPRASRDNISDNGSVYGACMHACTCVRAHVHGGPAMRMGPPVCDAHFPITPHTPRCVMMARTQPPLTAVDCASSVFQP